MTYISKNPYAEMHMYEAAQEIVINTVSQYHMVYGFHAGACNGWTFNGDDKSGAITDTENNGGVLRCTDVGHGLTTGDIISLTGMGNVLHNGVTAVTVISADVFDCDDIVYNSIDDTGTWNEGSYLEAGAGVDGVYFCSFSASVDADANNKIAKFEFRKNATEIDTVVAERKFAIGDDVGSVSACGLVSISAGDRISLTIEGKTDTTNFDFEHANINLHKL